MIHAVRDFHSRSIRFAGDLLRRSVSLIFTASARIFSSFERWLIEGKHARYGLAIARMLLGVVIVGTVLTNLSTAEYTFGGGSAWTGQQGAPGSSFATIWPFSIIFDASPHSIQLVMMLLVICGVLFGIGYRTRLVMIPLFVLWIGFLSVNPLVQDQSDNLTRIALIAMFFASPGEVWSVDSWRRRRTAGSPGRFFLVRWWRFQTVLPEWMTSLSHNIAVIVIGAQLCMIYAAGGLFKAQGSPWYSGYAVYNPISTAQFGTWPELSALVTTWGPLVALATIMSVLVQVAFPLLLLRRGTRIFGLSVILAFHVSIGVLMGLPWFSLAMVALDAVFIRDTTFREIADALRHSWERARSKGMAAQDSEPATDEDALAHPDTVPVASGA